MSDSTERVIAKSREAIESLVAAVAVLEEFTKELQSRTERDRLQEESDDE